MATSKLAKLANEMLIQKQQKRKYELQMPILK